MSPARTVVSREGLLDAALDLFTEHGISGTSLQMIADRIGVTKAAVYHRFPAKEDIVLAVLAPVVTQLTASVERAEAQRSAAARQREMIVGLVDTVIAHRRTAAVLHADPSASHLLSRHPELGGLTARITVLLTGGDPSEGTLVATAVFGGGLMTVGQDPQLSRMADDVLRTHLADLGLRLLRKRR